MKLLVTGVSGSIGHYIVQQAQEAGVDVVQTSLHGGKNSLACDLLNPEKRQALLAKTKPTHIIHTSWVTTHPSYWTATENLHWAEATLNFQKEFIALGGQHFLFIGSCAEYDWSSSYLIENQTVERPLSLYGAAKLLTSQQVLRDAEQLGTKAVIARLFHPFSENENSKRVFPLVVDTLLRGEAITLRNGDIYRDIYHSSEAAQAINGLSQNNEHGLFNIARGRPVHLGEFIAEAATLLNRRELLNWEPWDIDIQPGHPQVLLGSGAKISDYMPASLGFTEGLEKLIDNRKKLMV